MHTRDAVGFARVVALAFFGVGVVADPHDARADAPLVFVADPRFGMEGGVRTIDSVARVVFRYEEALPVVVRLDERVPLERAAGVLGRVAKLVLLDEPIAETSTAVVHEVYGHGARARDLGDRATYTLRLPGVYCALLSPKDQSCISFYEEEAGPSEADRALLTTVGGFEANMLTAWWIDARIVGAHGAAHHDDLLVYEMSKLVYASSLLSRALDTAGGIGSSSDDPDHYVTELQERFNRVGAADRATIASHLRTAYFWNVLDPMLLFAAYGTARHLATGETTLQVPLPRAFGATFYASPRFALSPFGAEHYLDLFVARGSSVVDAYGRVGSSRLARYAGGGVRALGLPASDRLTLGAELDVWKQPEAVLDVHAAYDRPDVWGMNVGASADVRVVGALGVTARLAWKTRGWLAGQPVDEGLHGYAGVTIAWDRVSGSPSQRGAR